MGQSNQGISSLEVPSSQVTPERVKLTIQTNNKAHNIIVSLSRFPLQMSEDIASMSPIYGRPTHLSMKGTQLSFQMRNSCSGE